MLLKVTTLSASRVFALVDGMKEHCQQKLLKVRGLGTSTERRKLKWKAAAMQLAHGHEHGS